MTLEASLAVIPAVSPVVVVVLHVVVVGDLIVVLVQHEGLSLVVGEDLQLVLTARHIIVLVLADDHLRLTVRFGVDIQTIAYIWLSGNKRLIMTFRSSSVVTLTLHIPVSSGSGLLIISLQLVWLLLMEILGSSAQFWEFAPLTLHSVSTSWLEGRPTSKGLVWTKKQLLNSLLVLQVISTIWPCLAGVSLLVAPGGFTVQPCNNIKIFTEIFL